MNILSHTHVSFPLQLSGTRVSVFNWLEPASLSQFVCLTHNINLNKFSNWGVCSGGLTSDEDWMDISLHLNGHWIRYVFTVCKLFSGMKWCNAVKCTTGLLFLEDAVVGKYFCIWKSSLNCIGFHYIFDKHWNWNVGARKAPSCVSVYFALLFLI